MKQQKHCMLNNYSKNNTRKQVIIAFRVNWIYSQVTERMSGYWGRRAAVWTDTHTFFVRINNHSALSDASVYIDLWEEEDATTGLYRAS